MKSNKALQVESLLDATISKLKQSQKQLGQCSHQNQNLKDQVQILKDALQDTKSNAESYKSFSQAQNRKIEKFKAVQNKRTDRLKKVAKDLHILLEYLKISNQYMTQSVGIMKQGKQFDQKVVVALTQLEDCQDQGIYRQVQMLDELFEEMCKLLQEQIKKNNQYLNDAPFDSWDFNSDDDNEDDQVQQEYLKKIQRVLQDCNESKGLIGYQTAASSEINMTANNFTSNISVDQMHIRTQSRQTSKRTCTNSGATPKFKKDSVHNDEMISNAKLEQDEEENKSISSSQCSSPFGKKSTQKKKHIKKMQKKKQKQDQKYDQQDLKLIIKHLAFKFGNSACNLNTVDAFLQRMRKEIAQSTDSIQKRQSAIFTNHYSASEFKLNDNIDKKQEMEFSKKRASIINMKDAFNHQKQLQRFKEQQSELEQQINKMSDKLEAKQVQIAKLKGKLIQKQNRVKKQQQQHQIENCQTNSNYETIIQKLQKVLKNQSQNAFQQLSIEKIFGKDIAQALSRKIKVNLQSNEYKSWITDLQKLMKFQNKIFEVTKILSQDITADNESLAIPPRVVIQSKTLKQDFPQEIQIQMDRQINQKLLDIHNRKNNSSNDQKQLALPKQKNSQRRVTFDGIGQLHYFSNQSDIMLNLQQHKNNSTLMLQDDDQLFRDAANLLLPLQQQEISGTPQNAPPNNINGSNPNL